MSARTKFLPFHLTSRVGSYTAGAAAGAITLVSSNAAIIYVNAGNQIIADTTPNNGASRFFDVDLNGDTVVDFQLRTRIDPTDGAAPESLAQIVPSPVVGSTVGIMGAVVGGFPYADRLAADAIIDGSAGFLTLTRTAPTAFNVASLAYGPGYANSEWAFAGSNSGYLGVRFNIGADQHFAWVRLTVEPNNAAQPRAFILHEWAYESTPGVGIAAGAVPEPTSLGLLALGSIGLTAHRRRRRAAAR